MRFDYHDILWFRGISWIVAFCLLWLFQILGDVEHYFIVVGWSHIFIFKVVHIVLILLGFFLVSLHLTFSLLRPNWFWAYLIDLRTVLICCIIFHLWGCDRHGRGVLASHSDVATGDADFGANPGGADASTSLVGVEARLGRCIHYSVFALFMDYHYRLVMLEPTVSSRLVETATM